MTGPVCQCGHSKLSHEVERAPACCQAGCGCGSYRLLQPGERPTMVRQGDAVERLLREAKDSGAPKCVGLAERIEAQLEQLRERLKAEHAREAARAEVRRLEAQLAEARSKAGGVGRRAPRRSVSGIYECSDCPESFTTPQGRGAHRSRAHGYRRATA